jgi:hypothetical protein
MRTTICPAAAAAVLALAACASPGGATESALRPAMERFLAERGDLCLGKFDWPIEVSERDARIGTRDAIQMPVLEKVGIVSSSPEAGKTRYELTETGRKYYIGRETAQVSPDGKKTVHHGDFCVGKLSLDTIVGWDEPRTVGDQQETTVTYTYHIAAAPWTFNPDVQKVFPMVERIVKGQGTMELKQSLKLTRDGWVATSPWE